MMMDDDDDDDEEEEEEEEDDDDEDDKRSNSYADEGDDKDGDDTNDSNDNNDNNISYSDQYKIYLNNGDDRYSSDNSNTIRLLLMLLLLLSPCFILPIIMFISVVLLPYRMEWIIEYGKLFIQFHVMIENSTTGHMVPSIVCVPNVRFPGKSIHNSLRVP